MMKDTNHQTARIGRPSISLGMASIAAAASVLFCGSAQADPNSDWLSRSTAPGVVMATRFDTKAEVLDYVHPDGTADHVVWTTGNKASGNGSMRMNILKTDRRGSGSWVHYLADDQREFGPGDTFYVQFRQYFPSYLVSHVFKGVQYGGPYGGGWKQAIISNHRGSNQLFEVVLQNTNQRGIVQGYNRDSGGAYDGWSTRIDTPCSTTDFVFQNMIDRGGPENTCLESRRKRGGLYSYGSNTGMPDPETGAFRFYTDEWLTFLIKVSPGSFGQGSNVKDSNLQVWAARQADTEYTHLYDVMVNLGDEADKDGKPYYFDAIWLLPYHTDREPDPSRQDTYTLYDELIVSTQPINAPGGGVVPGDHTPPAPPSNVESQ